MMTCLNRRGLVNEIWTTCIKSSKVDIKLDLITKINYSFISIEVCEYTVALIVMEDTGTRVWTWLVFYMSEHH